MLSYHYSTPDNLIPEFGAWSQRIDWCDKNCKGAWKYKLKGEFVFFDKDDYLLFLLAWG